MSVDTPPTRSKRASEVRAIRFNFSDRLDSGETISTATMAVVSGLTFGTPVVNVAVMEVEDNDGTYRKCAIGKGVTVTVTGGTAGTTYTLKCTITTSGSQTIISHPYSLAVVADSSAF